MFAVIHKNRVVVGPMSWNRAMFTGALERSGVTETISRAEPESNLLPQVFNEDTRIAAVTEVRPQLNPMIQYYYGPLWDLTGDIAVANYEVHDTPIEAARQNFKQQAADERWKKETKGTTVTLQGQTLSLNTDRASRDNYVQKYVLMADQDTLNWKFPEGWLTLTKTEMYQVVKTAGDYVQGCFDWEKQKSDEIDAATTGEELVAIEIIEKPTTPQ